MSGILRPKRALAKGLQPRALLEPWMPAACKIPATLRCVCARSDSLACPDERPWCITMPSWHGSELHELLNC